MKLTSNAFLNGEFIPTQYTCDGNDLSPQLHWTGEPENTKSFVLIVDDPDAPMGNWDHWLLFNIPSDINQLKEAFSKLPSGTKEGKNSWEKTGYGGPCPPSNIHRYFFKLYALDTLLSLENGATKDQLIQAMQGHVLAQAELMGRYERQRNLGTCTE
ncbi:MAG: hypothetical protein A3E82_04605 [Gammaproteobacteria bacterium RIFCSPHIGHO2_12_FULL_38_11]|nr:MAG: hypothetical protein A3E82_04605 [Gammaproteobacteria bacterium RIFCSPHIGHO2_12_FULL_38_11]